MDEFCEGSIGFAEIQSGTQSRGCASRIRGVLLPLLFRGAEQFDELLFLVYP